MSLALIKKHNPYKRREKVRKPLVSFSIFNFDIWLEIKFRVLLPTLFFDAKSVQLFSAIFHILHCLYGFKFCVFHMH